jgi:hypothetical protein
MKRFEEDEMLRSPKIPLNCPYSVEGCKVISVSFGANAPLAPVQALAGSATPLLGKPVPQTLQQLTELGGGDWWYDVADAGSPFLTSSWFGYVLDLYPVAGVQILNTKITISCYSSSWMYGAAPSSGVLCHTIVVQISRSVELVRVMALTAGLVNGDVTICGSIPDTPTVASPPYNGLTVSGFTSSELIPYISSMSYGDPRCELFIRRLIEKGWA